MALEGARDIVAETICENADLLGRLRNHMRAGAQLKARVVAGKQEAGAKFADYFDHTERWATAPGHRALAMLRGWNRSEEHTSELQSLMRSSYAVFCLKKKKHSI